MLEKGEIVLIDNKEYVILSLIKDNLTTYIYLESLISPKKIYIGKMTDENSFETLTNKVEIEYALNKFNEAN